MRPDFLWGVATSAFQLEGCAHADWALWDPVLQSRPDITHHYRLFRAGFKITEGTGCECLSFLAGMESNPAGGGQMG